MEVFRLPLTNLPQNFPINFGGKSFILETKWNGFIPAWELSFFDANTNEKVFSSLPLITGSDIISQYRFNELLAGFLICFSDGDVTQNPTEQNLGTNGNLFYVTEV